MVPDPHSEQPWNSRPLPQGIKDGQFCHWIHLFLFQGGLFWIFLNAPEELKGIQNCQLLDDWNCYLITFEKSKNHRVAVAQSITISRLAQQGDQCAFSLYRILEVFGSLNFAGSLSFWEWGCWMPDCTMRSCTFVSGSTSMICIYWITA